MDDLRSVDLNLLPTLHALLEEHSVTRAATRLGMSTPAVSQALGRLREQLGDALLVRAGRGMVPTARALALRPRVAAVVEDLRGVFAHEPEFEPGRSKRSFLIHASDYVLCVLGVALDGLVRESAPGITLNIMPNTPADAQLVRDGEIDLAIGVYGGLPPETRIQKLFDEDFVCVVRADHPEVRRRLSLKRYVALEHLQIAPRGRSGGVVDDALRERGESRFVSRRVPYFFSALSIVAASDMVLTIPRRLAHARAAQFGLRVLDVPIALESYALSQIWHPRRDGDDGHGWLRARVRDAVAATKPRR